MAKVLKIRKRQMEEEDEPMEARTPKTRKVAAEVPAKKKKRSRQNSGRFTGQTTGLGVAAFQNKTLDDNRKKKLTDDELAALWAKEFPNAIATYTADTVRGVRLAFNRGQHGNEAPATPVFEYDANRKPITAKPRAKDEEEEEAPRRRKVAAGGKR